MPGQPEYKEIMLCSEEIYDGMIIKLTRDTIRLVNGREAVREVVHHGGGAGIVALNENNEIALVRQYRYAVGKELVELPAGKVEAGEHPRDTAVRELADDLGQAAADRQLARGHVGRRAREPEAVANTEARLVAGSGKNGGAQLRPREIHQYARARRQAKFAFGGA